MKAKKAKLKFKPISGTWKTDCLFCESKGTFFITPDVIKCYSCAREWINPEIKG